MKGRLFKVAAFGLSASTLLSAAPLGAQSAVPAAAAVSAYYSTRSQPIWFRGGVASPAVAQLVTILERAPFDGFASGPQLAAQVQAAVGQARSGNPTDVAAAERVISATWVQYVQALKRPTPGMDYIYPFLQPQGSRADQILMTAAAAPSLERHLAQVSGVNPIYAALREAGLAEAQASGNPVPDARLLTNLDRARSIPAAGKYVVVDVAGQRLTMFENGQAVDSMKVIVGTSQFPTPMLASVIYYITLNPYWDAPHHLVKTAIAPNVLKQGFGYMKARGYEVMADWTDKSAVIPSDQVDWKAVAAGKKQIRVRQKPGPQNFMATMKIPFPNRDNIFLHDTPAKELFAKSQRALSNGCIRLEDAPRFARWLMGGRDPVAMSSEPEQHIQLGRGVPVYVTYLTAQPKDGRLTYTADVYGWDKAATKQVASR